MWIRKNTLAIAAILLVLGVANVSQAEERDVTTITVPSMHCAGCAKKMAKKLQAVPGVADVQADLDTAAMIVIAEKGENPSPKLLWEAVVKAGYKPAKLDGPDGTFTSKPRS